MAKRTCSIEGCERSSRARGWCDKHWQRWRKHGDPERSDLDREDPVRRFWAKVEKTDDCWVWMGATTAKIGGHGQFRVGGKTIMAHRFAYELMVGPIPTDEAAGFRVTIDHLCRNRLCVRPDHLEVVSHQENIRRGIPRCAKKTHCVNGHPFDVANTGYTTEGHRRCRACARERARRNSRRTTG